MSINSTNYSSLNSMQLLTQMNGGIDTNTLIQELDMVNRQQIYQPGGLESQLTKVQQQQTDWQNINNSAMTLQNQLTTLMQTNFNSYNVTSSDSTDVTATGGSGATPGTYTLTNINAGSYGSLTSNGRLGNALSASDAITATKFSALLTTGQFAVTDNGVTQQIQVQSGDTIGSVLSRITSTFSDISYTVNSNGSITFSDTGSKPVTFGSSGDTSNFAHVLGMDTLQLNSTNTPTPYQATTQINGQAQINETLNSGSTNLTNISTLTVGTPPSGSSATTGQFQVNGVTITYDTSQDSIASILTKINSSSAGVTAAYNQSTDQIVLTSKSAQPVSVNDLNGGNLTQVLDFTNSSGSIVGTQKTGSNWTLNYNGTTYSSASPNFTNVIPGLTINVLNTPAVPSGQTQNSVNLTVASDTTSAVSAVQNFISQFNSLYSQINNLTANGGDLQGDNILQNLGSNMMLAVTQQVKTIGWDSNNNPIPLPSYPYNSVMGIGISTGAPGSAVSTSYSLQLDSNQLTAQIQQNPQMVHDLLQGMSISLNNVLTGITGMTNSLNDPTLNVSNVSGLASSQNTMYTNMITDINDQIQQVNDQADQQKQLLIQEFTNMNQVLSQLQTQGKSLSSFIG
ncbi:flagellar filament capping protein FliD [Fodinisporobacter ferrooxydans]|uniref:Flagellar hook-associated protein 2 n=1 Tax=Fodinisporobacter ferrooxydans TaxID=2901836 RepID=A0ABY4CU49_9BACL|nr:flagellar filament capping protein FliD [Alicyclobacillaceae bacterium MYW30-H2]